MNDRPPPCTTICVGFISYLSTHLLISNRVTLIPFTIPNQQITFAIVLVYYFFFFLFFNPFDHLLQTNILIIHNSTIASHFSFQRIILPCQPVSYHHYSSSSSLLSAIRFIITARSDKNPPVVACSRLRVNPGRADISGSLKVVLDRLCAVRLLVGRARVPLPLIPTNHPRSSQALSRDSEKSGIKSSRCFCAL